MEIAFAPEDIAGIVKPVSRRGATAEIIRGIAGLDAAQTGDISFLGNSKYRSEVAETRASVVLLPPDYPGEPKPGQLFLLVENPSLALARICARLEHALWPKPAPGIHSTAVVDPAASVAPSATLGPHCVVEAGAVVGARCFLQARVFIGRGARLGDDCWLMAGATVAPECVLGNRVRMQPGAVVGSDGFGYEFAEGRHERVPQLGTVILEDDVELGANTTLDRGRFGRTLIGEGTKIDNLVQVGHNTIIGKHCLLVAQAGISGSTVLEDYVVIGGQVGTVGHITVGKGTQVGAKSGISKSQPPGIRLWGTPAVPLALEQRLLALRNRLPELFKRVQALEDRLRTDKPGT